MEINTTSIRMSGLVGLYDLHSKFFHSAIAGISQEDAHERLNTKANHVAWLAGSLVQERFELANLFGESLRSEANEFFADHKGIQPDELYPSLASYAADWDKITPILRELMLNVNDEQLDKLLTFPGMSFTLYEMISFNTYREANCIGQIALWRRLLNYDPINYM